MENVGSRTMNVVLDRVDGLAKDNKWYRKQLKRAKKVLNYQHSCILVAEERSLLSESRLDEIYKLVVDLEKVLTDAGLGEIVKKLLDLSSSTGWEEQPW